MDNFWSLYGEFWKKCFDYRSTVNARQYWVPVGVFGALCVVTLTYFLLAEYVLDCSRIPGYVLTAFLLLSLVPGVSLTVRRLRTVGKSGLLALLLLIVGVGTVVVLMLCSGISFSPIINHPENVYGPPEWFESSEFDPSKNIQEDVYGPPEWFGDSEEETEPGTEPDNSFDPSENTPAPVYGPPEWFEDPVSETAEPETKPETAKAETEPETKEPEQEQETAAVKTETSSYDPTRNIPVAVYGPPEWFESSRSETETEKETKKETEKETKQEKKSTEETSEPGLIFQASENIQICVYGPPEWFTRNETAEGTSEEKTEEETSGETTEEAESERNTETPAAETPEETVFDATDNIPEDVYGPPEWFTGNGTPEVPESSGVAESE